MGNVSEEEGLGGAGLFGHLSGLVEMLQGAALDRDVLHDAHHPRLEAVGRVPYLPAAVAQPPLVARLGVHHAKLAHLRVVGPARPAGVGLGQ
jgi:hypothetical protein